MLAGFDRIFKDRASLKTFVDALHWPQWRPRFIVLHNTGAPNQKQWMATPGGEIQRLKNLEYYYRAQQKWSAGPHWFVSPDMWLMGTPSTQRGTHTPSWNAYALGIEMAGDFDSDAFDTATRDNVVYLLAALHAALGLQPAPFELGVRGLHFHKEDPGTTHKHCPGAHVVKPDIVKRVADLIVTLHAGDCGAHVAEKGAPIPAHA
jgi:hypothetical protein